MLSLTLFGAITVSQQINAIPDRDGIDYWDPTIYNQCKDEGGSEGQCRARSFDCICSADPNPECIDCEGRYEGGDE
ncbi:MAG: hypothetical protein OXE92_00180 [Bacteroidetes bacterium]|nr:hypothetical protein [Bacteroidota bacterium]